MALARLLTPEDFGLQGMVLAITGILAMFRDIGLSMATVQRETITHEQTSTLFWINVALGATLAALTTALTPALMSFYHEPRLFWMALASAATFLISGFGVQHSSLLLRGMKYVTLAKIEITSLVLSYATGIGMAASGCSYWSLIGMMVVGASIPVALVWIAVPWVPGRPHRGCGVRSMLHFGGTVTLNNLVSYVGYNAEKILLGRFCGAAALGLYGRAYSLVNLPTVQLHSAIYNVAFSALSRLQAEPQRLRNSFMKGYSIVVSLTIPVTICSVVFAEEIVRVALGPKWGGAVPIFRLLGPTVLAFGMINPTGWFLLATGRVVRSFKIALLIAPSVILGILIGLRYGPTGVALAYSTVMTLLIIPVIAWAIHGTGITVADFWKAMKPALLSGLCAGAAGVLFKLVLHGVFTPIPQLILGFGLVLGLYVWMLLMVMGQKDLFVDLAKHILHRNQPDAKKSGMSA